MCCSRRRGILVLGTLKLLLVNLLGLGLCGVQLSTIRWVYMPLYPLIQLYVATVLMLFGTIFSIVLLSGSYKWYSGHWELSEKYGKVIFVFAVLGCSLESLEMALRHRTSLRVYFWYSTIDFILSLLRVAHCIFLYIISSMYTAYEGWRLVLYSPDFYILIFLFGLFDLVLQLCIMILVKQEINKLGSTRTSDGTELQGV